jgi:hypothetical protein
MRPPPPPFHPPPPGYPLQTFTVVTEDGYVLRMERIPRPGAPDVALFMHGARVVLHLTPRLPALCLCVPHSPAISPLPFLASPPPAGVLDTSLTWVSSGVTGSQAFAAWDQGFDVWLGSSRSNPPYASTGTRVAGRWACDGCNFSAGARRGRAAQPRAPRADDLPSGATLPPPFKRPQPHPKTDPARQGMGYWEYTLNELGIYDVAAQVDKLHEVKMQVGGAWGFGV